MAEQKIEVLTDEQVVRHKKRDKEMAPAKMTLNLTSMIDVIFLLLIYFVITASFSMGEGVIVANLPRGTGLEPDPDKPPPLKITVALTTLGNQGVGYRINLLGFPDAPHNFKQLATLLIKYQHNPKKGRHGRYPPDSPVIIQPTAAVRWQHVVNAFNATLKAQYENISFAQVSQQ